MALAAAVQQIEAEGAATLTNYAAFLAANPPRTGRDPRADLVELRPRHRALALRLRLPHRGDWHQRWRAPLREALDWLRDQIDPFFEARASAHLKDPWAARDDYAACSSIKSPERLDAFAAHARGQLDPAARVEARRLLELERNRLLMYTSCGWFFDEISAIEPVQILRYAAMALRYMNDLGGGAPGRVRPAAGGGASNVPEMRDGAEVYRRLIGRPRST
jgi:hypothetical protein